jgi:ABC-type transport system involved in cytochrome c biogenesis permease component
MTSPTKYFDSTPGRLLLGAMAMALLIGGSYALTGKIVILAAGMPAVIAIGFVACGLSIAEHGSAALWAVISLPLALLLFGVGVGVAHAEGRVGFAWGFVLLGALGAVRAVGIPSAPEAHTVRTNE